MCFLGIGCSSNETTNEFINHTTNNTRQQAAYGSGWLVGDNSSVNVNYDNSDYRVSLGAMSEMGNLSRYALDGAYAMGGRAFDLAGQSLANNTKLVGQVSNLKAGVDGTSRTINNVMAVMAVGAMAVLLIKR